MEVNSGNLTQRLESIGPKVRVALKGVLGPLAKAIEGDAKARASAHIHFIGLKKPGSYLESIKGGVADKGPKVTGYVRSGHPLAHLLEFGANTPAHEILPSASSVLAFLMPGAATVFAKAVKHPGAVIPPYPAIYPAFDARKGQIEQTMKRTVLGDIAAAMNQGAGTGAGA